MSGVSRRVGVVGCGLSLALVLAVLPGRVASADPSPAPVPTPSSSGKLTRPDWVSASVTTRATGRRVEVLSQRTETTRVWARPDGIVDEEVAAAPVRFEDSSAVDGWRCDNCGDDRGWHRKVDGQGCDALVGGCFQGL
jgi:hypothetical protein